jgi:hypothetical protein
LHLQATGELPTGVDAEGNEVFLNAPNFGVAIKALSEIAKVLNLITEPVVEEDDQLSQALAEIKAERAALN